MTSIEDYGQYQTSWCPGCGNFGILKALKIALADSGIEPHRLVIVSGIGQAAKAPHYLNANVFNGLHGRALPVATAIKLANRELVVIAESGDGCHLAEGGNHFLHALRRNPDLTVLLHNNQVYGLTKGQASPTSEPGFKSAAQPLGNPSAPLNPVAVAVAMKAGLVARSFSAMTDHLAGMIKEAIAFPGLALVDVLQPCVSFNRVNTFAWYQERVRPLPPEYDPADWETAMRTADQWGDTIPIGIIYRRPQPVFEDRFPALARGPLVDQQANREILKGIMQSYG